VWDLRTGERTDLPLDVPGDVAVAGWWPDGSALLLLHEHDGRSELLHCDPAAPAPHAARRVRHPDGTIMGAGVRPDGQVWYRVSSGAQAASIRNDRDEREEVIAPDGERAPDGRPYRSFRFANPRGDEVHGFLAAPTEPGPHPIVMDVHGGPTWQYADEFSPATQAWVDHGYAVAKVNYRGSVGYGTAFRDALIGNPGFPEVEDVVAALDALVADGVADASRAILAGASWGGYITLLGLGLRPDRWAAGLAAVPVADYVAAYEDEAPGLQAFDGALFGGSPDEVPDLYRERSPITYVDRVAAPILILAGDNDTRCPIRQILNYVERLEARGATCEVYRYDAGHGSLVIEERIRQMATQLAFVQDRVPA
jgi:dipeptidyl aminopeptidase/acylaminoacyl peptidase